MDRVLTPPPIEYELPIGDRPIHFEIRPLPAKEPGNIAHNFPDMFHLLVPKALPPIRQWIFEDSPISDFLQDWEDRFDDWGGRLDEYWHNHPYLSVLIGGGVGVGLSFGIPLANERLDELGAPLIPTEYSIGPHFRFPGFVPMLGNSLIDLGVSGRLYIGDVPDESRLQLDGTHIQELYFNIELFRK